MFTDKKEKKDSKPSLLKNKNLLSDNNKYSCNIKICQFVRLRQNVNRCVIRFEYSNSFFRIQHNTSTQHNTKRKESDFFSPHRNVLATGTGFCDMQRFPPSLPKERTKQIFVNCKKLGIFPFKQIAGLRQELNLSEQIMDVHKLDVIYFLVKLTETIEEEKKPCAAQLIKPKQTNYR